MMLVKYFLTDNLFKYVIYFLLLNVAVCNLVPRVLRLLGQRFGRQERLWGNGIFSIFLIGYSGNNEIGEAEVGSM